MMEINEARRVITERLSARPAVSLPLGLAAGNVTASPLRSPMDSPAFDQSAMDGYAIASPTLGPHPLVDRGARRVATGQPVPDWAHCVVPQENCRVETGSVHIEPGTSLEPGVHIRSRGGSFRVGTEVLPAGSLLTPGAIALAASCGCAELSVREPVSALHVATGSELVTAPRPLVTGQVYDSNGPMMAALLQSRGISCRRILTGDDAADLRRALLDFPGELILVSGGSGPGDQDHTARALSECGFHVHISGVKSRPGKPLIFATRGDQAAFGLPGNPLSQWVCFHVFVRAALDAWNGWPAAELTEAECPDWKQVPGDGRPIWTPATVHHAEGRIRVHPIPWKHSGDLMPLAHAAALVFGSPDPKTGLVPALLL